jgi:hypothetical protein
LFSAEAAFFQVCVPENTTIKTIQEKIMQNILNMQKEKCY